jgi:PKD repeat protein
MYGAGRLRHAATEMPTLYALLALFFCVLVIAPAQAAEPLAGIDCDCDSVGDFVLPEPPVDIKPPSASTSLSPLSHFKVTAEGQLDGTALISVTEVVSATEVLEKVPGVAWGFSPDDDERFVVYYRVAGLTHARVYNLVGLTPKTPIIDTDSLGGSGKVVFSPHGHHALVMWLGSEGPEHFKLRVFDARTGALHHSDHFIFAPPIGLPPGADEVGSVRVGFGPDAEDRSLVYAWIAPNQQKSLRILNLTPGAVRSWQDAQNFPFTWGFSPCGDRFATVWESLPLQKVAYLQSTLDFARLGNVTLPLASPGKVSTTPLEHRVVLPSSTLKLADNLADTACSVTPPPAPVAAFNIGAPRLSRVPVPFNDASNPVQGTLALWHWSFADGTFSNEQNPSHVFASAGTYEVQLTVTNSAGRASSLTKSVVVAENQRPAASFTYVPQPPFTRDNVTFTSTSTDDDGIASVYWTLGEVSGFETTFTSKVCAPSANVTLIVTDHAGQSAEAQLSIPITGSSFVPVEPGEDLQAAADGACLGDTLQLSAGAYAGGVELRGVNLMGIGRAQTFVNGPGDVSVSKGWVLSVQNSRVEGLTLSGGALVVDEFQEQGGGVRVRGEVALHDVDISNNAGVAGVFLENHADGVVITDSALHDNEPAGVVLGCCSELTVARSEIAFHRIGVTVNETGDVLVEDNDFHDNERAIMISASARVSGNRFHDNGTAITASFGSSELAGNLIVKNQVGVIGRDSASAIVTSSTIADNCQIGVQAGTSNISLFNSIVTGNGTNVEGALATSDSNLIGSPGLFVSDSDFHLSTGAAAIDAGVATYLPDWLTQDGDGDVRSDATVDIGWDEWTPGQPTMHLATPSCESIGGAPGDGGAPGGGGAPGEGGSSDQGGAVHDYGGAPDAGASGTPNGGSPAGAMGGTSTTNGGTPAVGAGGSPMAGAGGEDEDGEHRTIDDGCTCRVGTRSHSTFAPSLFGLMLSLWLARRRSTRARSQQVQHHLP